MSTRIVVIHSSEIVRLGLLNILKESFDKECVLLSTIEELKNYNSITKSRLVFLVDSQLDQKDLSKQLGELDPSNSVKILLVRERAEEKQCVDNCDCCFHTSDSKDRIIDLLKPYLLEESAQADSKSSSLLTDREIEVVKLIALGKTNKEMAKELFISIHTIISHRKNITEKLGIKSISGLTVYAILNNLIDANSIDIESLI